jgi:hypothetical protein
MYKLRFSIFLLFLLCIVLFNPQSYLKADPTFTGGKGQLRVLAANNEPFESGMPLLYFSFYQGYANEKIADTCQESERTLSNTLTLTFLLTEKMELSTAFKGMILPSFEEIVVQAYTNEWRFKYLVYQMHTFSFSIAPDISFPIGDEEEAESKFGGYMLGTLEHRLSENIGLEFNTNLGFFSSEETMIPVGFSLSVLTKYSEFFLEYSAENVSNSDYEMRITPGIRLNPGRGVTFTLALDKTFSTVYPDKRLNLLFSWLGPFSVFGAEKKE